MSLVWNPAQEENPATKDIATWPLETILTYSTDELLYVHRAIRANMPACTIAAGTIIRHVRSGGRVITIGAGGSGVAGMSVMRELPQNHEAIHPDIFTYRIAGGSAILDPYGCEELEDDAAEGTRDVDDLHLTDNDIAILISASGRTPYTRSAAVRARAMGAYTIGLVCAKSELLAEVVLPIYLDVGPEMLIGATCEKAATAQKHILDVIMNGVVIGLGITDGNRCAARLVHEKARARKEFFDSMERRRTHDV